MDDARSRFPCLPCPERDVADLLHLTPAGYAVWTPLLAPLFKESASSFIRSLLSRSAREPAVI